METIKLYESASSDGCRGTGDGVFYLGHATAKQAAVNKHQGYATDPITHAEAQELFWSKAEASTKIDRNTLRRCWLDAYMPSTGIADFVEFVTDGSIKKEEVLSYCDNTTAKPTELQTKLAHAANHELMRRLRYDLKKTIQVGDELKIDKDEFGFSSGTLLLKGGSRYKIVNLQDKGGVSFVAEHESELPRAKHIGYHGEHALWALWRDGVKIWDWHLCYYELSIELDPNMDEEQRLKLKARCEEQASKNP